MTDKEKLLKELASVRDHLIDSDMPKHAMIVVKARQFIEKMAKDDKH